MLVSLNGQGRLARARRALSAVAAWLVTVGSIAPAAGAAQQIRYYHPDALGSVNVVTDEQGRPVEVAEYTPYGAYSRRDLLAALAPATPSPAGFTAQRRDTSTGLYYYNARYYDPHLGRFISPDTIIEAAAAPQTLNRYSYVRNAPTNRVDPSGHWSFRKWLKSLFTFESTMNRMKMTTVSIPPEVKQEIDKAINSGINSIARHTGIDPAYLSVAVAAAPHLATGNVPGALLAAGIAYGANELMETREVRQLVQRVAHEFFDDVMGMSPDAALAMTHQLASASISIAVSLTSQSARHLYQKTVGYEVTWAKGDPAIGKKWLELPHKGLNNIGTQHPNLNPNGWLNEGGRLSRLGNATPGVNATSGMHDVFQVRLDEWGGKIAGHVLNVPGMPPAAAITYAGLLTADGTPFIYYSFGSQTYHEN